MYEKTTLPNGLRIVTDSMPAIKSADESGVLSSALQFSPSTKAIGRTENLVPIENQTGLADPLRRLASLTSSPKQRATVASRLKISNKSRWWKFWAA